VKDTGKSVTKGAGLTDDIFRATVLGVAYVLDEEFAAQYLVLTKRRTNYGLGAYGSLGGNGNDVQGNASKIGAVGSLGGSSSASNGQSNVFALTRRL
jgi:hypothetical protein